MKQKNISHKQISLFDKSYFEIKKHSSIVQMSNIATLQERKVMNALLRIAKDNLKRTPDDRVFTTDLGILKRLTGLKKNDNTELKDALRNLASMAVEYNIMHKDDANEWGIFRFISEVKIREEGVGKSTSISFEFPTSILETIKNPNMFVKLDLMIIRGLESKHSIVLYEFIKDYLNLGKLRCDIGNFRKLMGIQNGQYENFTMLRKRVIDIAVEEINRKTDIVMSYELEKFGRLTTAIIFIMHPKENSRKDDTLIDNVKSKLKFYGVAESVIEELIQRHDLEYLSANLNIVEDQIKKGNIQNVTGYLLKAFQTDFRVEETEYNKEQKEKQEKKLQEIEQRNKEAKELEEQEKENLRQKREQAKEYLTTLSEDETKILWDEFISSKENNIIFSRLDKKFGAESPIIEGEWLKYLSEKNLSDEKSIEGVIILNE